MTLSLEISLVYDEYGNTLSRQIYEKHGEQFRREGRLEF